MAKTLHTALLLLAALGMQTLGYADDATTDSQMNLPGSLAVEKDLEASNINATNITAVNFSGSNITAGGTISGQTVTAKGTVTGQTVSSTGNVTASGTVQATKIGALSNTYTWLQNNSACRMIPQADGFCFLTEIQGKYEGSKEHVEIYASGGYWYMSGDSGQKGVGGKAMCFMYQPHSYTTGTCGSP